MIDINPLIANVVAAKRKLGKTRLVKDEAIEIYQAAEADFTAATQALNQAVLRAIADASDANH